ncbi:DUF6056 family protein [Kluyvera intermedia]|uniref:DUF6056 family protein n=2 Tax=Kluyvera intermedia TaxID=61648 RepID=UPI003525558E
MKNKKINILLFLVPAYILIAALAIMTPLHSDDFGTRIAGFPNIPNHIKRYMEWSGRLTPDFLASFILWSDSHIIRSLLNAIGTFGVIAMISKIPYSISSKKIDYGYVLMFYIVMSVMWFTSPNLGQTSFWIVGATNYIWTNLFILLVLDRLAINSTLANNAAHSLIGIFLLSFVAACGNENMSLVLVGITFLYCLYSFIFNKESVRVGLSSFTGTFLGAAVLLLAPGNFRRMSMEGDWWKDASWSYRLWLWAFKKMPFIIEVNLPVMGIILVLIALIVFSGSLRSSWNENRAIYLSIPSFLFLMFIANLVLIGSPAYPPRAANGQYILLLCAMSSTLLLCISHVNKIVIFSLCILLMGLGVWSYTLMARAYYYIYLQENVRLEIMKNEKNRGNTSATIPEYFFRELFSAGDKFDLFKPKQIPYYFGLKEVRYIKPNFDYSIIRTDGSDLHIKLGDYAHGVKAWSYNNSLICNDHVIVIMIDHYDKDVWKLHEQGFGLSKSVKINGESYDLSSEPRLYVIDGHAYFALNFGKRKPPKSISTISR